MLHLITGGSGSGKSAYAENQIVMFGEGVRIYIATMYPFDEECHQRIARHRQMRKEKQFKTLECYTNIKQLRIPKGGHVLLECMSNLAANEIYQQDGAGENTVESILEGIEAIEKKASNLVVVTNEIFSDGIVYSEETLRYQSYLGRINEELGKRAQKVTEVVYGIPIVIKGERL